MHLAPADYERKQTLVNAERFTTPELKELEGKILEAEEKILAIERELFEQLRALAASHAARIKATAAAIAELDVTVALAEVAAEARYTRPKVRRIGRDASRCGPASGDRKTDGAGCATLHPERSLFPPRRPSSSP